jgi:hypothetical protein
MSGGQSQGYGVPPASYGGGNYKLLADDDAMPEKRCTCYNATGPQCRILVYVLTAVVAIMAVAFAIASAFVAQNLLSTQCYALHDAGGTARGLFQGDGSNRWFQWNMQYANTTALPIVEMDIYGPSPSFEDMGPLATVSWLS